MIERIAALLIGYVFGLIQTGYIYGKLNGIDIRKTGSGNAGTTNMLRTMGPKAGLITLLVDAFKAVAAMLVVRFIFKGDKPDMVYLLQIYAGAGAILGHDFPFYLGFKGGKGIACTAGLIIGMMDPYIFWGNFVLFFGIFFTLHYVSLASLLIYVGIVAGAIIRGQLRLGHFGTLHPDYLYEIYGILIALLILAFYQHRENIKRLIQGKERRTYISKEKNKAEAERIAKLG